MHPTFFLRLLALTCMVAFAVVPSGTVRADPPESPVAVKPGDGKRPSSVPVAVPADSESPAPARHVPPHQVGPIAGAVATQTTIDTQPGHSARIGTAMAATIAGCAGGKHDDCSEAQASGGAIQNEGDKPDHFVVRFDGKLQKGRLLIGAGGERDLRFGGLWLDGGVSLDPGESSSLRMTVGPAWSTAIGSDRDDFGVRARILGESVISDYLKVIYGAEGGVYSHDSERLKGLLGLRLSTNQSADHDPVYYLESEAAYDLWRNAKPDDHASADHTVVLLIDAGIASPGL